MEIMLSWAVKRLREPSTYAGLGILLAGFHIPNSDSLAHAIAMTAMGAAGILAMFMAEKGIKG